MAGAGGRRTLDGWANLLTKMGTSRDKRTGGYIAGTQALPFDTLVDLYRSDDMAGTIADAVPEEMTREWVDVKLSGTDADTVEEGPRARVKARQANDQAKEQAEAVEDWLDALEAPAKFQEALSWARAYGGAGILLGSTEGMKTDWSKPLEPGNLRSVDYLTVYASQELQAVAYYDSLDAPKFGEPSVYKLVPRAVIGPRSISNIWPEVHESRILRFDGVVAHRLQRRENYGWGDSVYQRCYEVLRDYGLTWASAANLLQDFAQAVLKIPGLSQTLAGDQEGDIVKRAEILDLTRAVCRMLILDTEEDFHREVTPLSGVPEILQQFSQRLAAAARMPVTLLLGQAPAGLNATGASDIRNWYDRVASMQNRRMCPQIRRLVELGCAASKGPTKGRAPAKITIEPRPLWQLDEVQAADVRGKMAAADRSNIEMGIVTPDEVRKSRHGGDKFSVETTLDTETREAFEATPADPSSPEAADLRDPAAGAPDAGAPKGGLSGAAKLQDTALNGAQVSSAVEIVQLVAKGALPRDTGVNMLTEFFNLDPERAERIMGSCGSGFEPKEAPTVDLPMPSSKDPSPAAGKASG